MKIRDLSNDEILSLIKLKIWQEECPVKIQDLRVIEVQHYDFDDEITNGKIMVCKSVSCSVLKIFQLLLELKFNIHSVKLIDEFQGDDDLSMIHNNSSAFNFRLITGKKEVSSHSYGTAIDLNPLQNPYYDPQKKLCLPAKGEMFLDRSKISKGMVEPVVSVFKDNGFNQWLGDRKEKPDYHHFASI